MIQKLGLFCLLALAGCATTAKSQGEEKPTYLLVITSKHGEIKKGADGDFELILDHGHIEKVLAFSNRPYRIVKEITGKELQAEWREGHNSFEQDPPNATVIIDQHLQTVVVLSEHAEGTRTIFKIRRDGPQNLVEKSGETQVFIDGGPAWQLTPKGWGTIVGCALDHSCN